MNAPLTPPKLPDTWAQSLLNQLLAIYGSAFRAKWADVKPDELRDVWATALGNMTGAQIKWALDYLKAGHPATADADPSWPPSIPAFVALCRQAPRPEVPKLPPPTISEQTKAKRIEQLAGQSVKAVAPGREWAHKLRSRWLSGENLLMAQVTMASEALEETWFVGDDRRRSVKPSEAAAA